MSKEILGITRSGIKENCKWNFIVKGKPCPRHPAHLWSDKHTKTTDRISNEELEEMYAFGKDLSAKVSVEDYQQFSFDDDEDPFDDYQRKVEESMELSFWKLTDVKMTVPSYLETHGNKGEVLNQELESVYMNGGCAVYAIALTSLHPNYQLAIDTWKFVDNGESEYSYDHVFCIDPETNHAFDSRGAFETPEALMDYGIDKGYDGLIHKEGENYKDLGFKKVSRDELREIIDDGHFTWDDAPEDVAITKQLIKAFNRRIS